MKKAALRGGFFVEMRHLADVAPVSGAAHFGDICVTQQRFLLMRQLFRSKQFDWHPICCIYPITVNMPDVCTLTVPAPKLPVTATA
jgi:hypothetical protein